MAKRKARRGARKAKPAKSASARRAAKRPARSPRRATPASKRRTTPARAQAPRNSRNKRSAKPAAKNRRRGPRPGRPRWPARSEGAAARPRAADHRRGRADPATVARHGSPRSRPRTGRRGLAERRLELAGMSEAITAGDVDVDLESAYFSGDETPGGDNPTSQDHRGRHQARKRWGWSIRTTRTACDQRTRS